MHDILSDPNFELASRHRKFGTKTTSLFMELAREQEVFEAITVNGPWQEVENWTGAAIGSLLQDMEFAGKHITSEARVIVEDWRPLEQPVDVKIFLTNASELGKAVRGAGNPPNSAHNLCIACERVGLALLPPPIALHVCLNHDVSAGDSYLSLLCHSGMLSIVTEQSGVTTLKYEGSPSFMALEDDWPLLVGSPLYPLGS